jgi:L-threonylcarbamoyladenylate synthase
VLYWRQGETVVFTDYLHNRMSPLQTAPDLEEAVSRAARCLRDGGLVAFPTDTLYGLGALASDDEAVEKLFQAKKRPSDKPLPLLLASRRDVDEVTEDVPLAAERLMEAFWPGALTLVLRRARGYESRALGGGDTVAIRVPAHPIALRLIREAGGPITGTSANVAGGSGPRTAADVRRALGDAVDFVLDGGPTGGELESTVVDLTGETPRLLREGAVSRAAVEEIAGRLEPPA